MTCNLQVPVAFRDLTGYASAPEAAPIAEEQDGETASLNGTSIASTPTPSPGATPHSSPEI